MRISDLRTETDERSARVVARVEYEDSERPSLDVFYEVPRQYGDSLRANPDAFLVGAVLPAARNGERRLTVEEAVCPRLTAGITTMLHWMAHWYGPSWRALQLDVSPRSQPLEGRSNRCTSMFLSGGVDSLAALRMNRLQVPPKHPASIKEGILVRGFSLRDEQNFAPALKSANAIAADTGLTLVPVATNVRMLDWDSEFWVNQLHGAALASVAHTLVSRTSLVHIASSYDIPHLQPWGSHPAIDIHYTSHEVTIHHDGAHMSRFAKTAMLGTWPVGLSNLRVCTSRPPVGVANCGRCEKCVRTRLGLLALGLNATSAFGPGELSPDAIQSVRIRSDYRDAYYADVSHALVRSGYHEHARGVDAVRDEYRRYKAARTEQDWRGLIKRIDRRVLGGALHRFQSRLKQTPYPAR